MSSALALSVQPVTGMEGGCFIAEVGNLLLVEAILGLLMDVCGFC